jgi:hypothetical protein
LLFIFNLFFDTLFINVLKGVVLSPYSFSVVAKHILGVEFGYDGVAMIPYATTPPSGGRTVPVPQPPQNSKWNDEFHFNSCMYPVFANIFQDGMVVNSETTRWLEVNWDPINDLKPDFFLFPFALSEFLSRAEPNPTYPTHAFYGKPLDNCAFLVEVVLVGKLGDGKITNEQVGQLFGYLAAMSATDCRRPRGIIYNSVEFIFAEYRANQLFDVLKCRWDMQGAWEVLVSKIRPSDWNSKIKVLLALISQHWTFGRVLGRGRFGLVCEAVCNSKSYALKIVGSDPEEVRDEFVRLVDCYSKCPDLVVAPTLNSFTVIGEEGSYYTMDEIGTMENPSARKVFLLLFQLHDRGIIHGDPRIANVITLSDSTLRWIDFRSKFTGCYEDLKILVESVSESAIKNIQVTRLMRSYSTSPCEAKMVEVYEAVKAFI